MMQHLPILVVILPLLMAPVCLLLPRRFSWWVAAGVSLLSFAGALKLALYVKEVGVIHYFLGGWLPPFGIAYRIDVFTAYVLVIVTAIAAAVIGYAYRTVPVEVSERRQPLFYCMYMLCLSGLLGIVATNDVFNIYVFLEISSLATYTLVACTRGQRKSLTSAFEYLIFGTIGATFFLIGIGLLYMVTGTLNITDMALRLQSVTHVRPVEAAFAFITLGLALKIAIFPLHVWLTNAYTYGPTFVSAFLAATATKVGIYVLIRFLFNVFGWGFSFAVMPLENILVVLGVAGALIGSLAALYEKNLRRRLAFSSVAQIGYIVLGIGLATVSGLTFATLHLFTHAIAKAALFVAVGAIFYRAALAGVDELHGIGHKMPLTMAGFVVAGMSLIGIPGTAGFISKWYFLTALIEANNWALVAVVVASTVMAFWYIWQVIESAYMHLPPREIQLVEEAPLSQLVPLWVLCGTCFFFGFNTHYTLDLCKTIARQLVLMGGAG